MPPSSPFLDAFTEAEWARLSAHAERVALADGARVLARGDPPRHVWVLLEGQLEATDPRSSPPTVLALMEPGALLGELSFLDHAPVSVDVIARGPGVCLRFEVPRLRQVLAGAPDLDAAFHRGVSAVLVARTRRLTRVAVTAGIGRVVRTDEIDRALALDPNLAAATAAAARSTWRVELRGDRATIGSLREATIRLQDARVAPVHAELLREGAAWRVVSRAPRPVVVDGAPVASAPVGPANALAVGRYRLRVDGDVATVEAPSTTSWLRARGLTRRVGGRTLLADVDLTVLGGEVVAVVGPSGAGKTTLMEALEGVLDAGEVVLDGHDFIALQRRLPATLGDVPQDDCLVGELTVAEALEVACRLRHPSADAAARASGVNRALLALGLVAAADQRIGDPARRGLSGGQRKRVSIGQELVSPPGETGGRVLLLDEPTAGLDPRSAADLVRVCRRLADEGRVVILVTHDLSPAMLDHVDHLLVVVGGRLAWLGPVDEAREHFGVTHIAALFDRLADRGPEAWAEAWAGSAAAACQARRAELVERLTTPPLPGPAEPRLGARLAALVGRRARALFRDRATLLVLVAQPAVVAAMMLLVFPRPTVGLVFLLVLSCFWLGMSAAVRELVADRVLWRRERRYGIRPSTWVGARLVVMGGAVTVQCLVLTLVAGLGVGMATFSLPALAASAWLVGMVGVCLGLATSAAWHRVDAAIGTIVLLLVPQLALSGVLTPLGEIHPAARWLSWLSPVRYALHLALSCGDELAYLGYLGSWRSLSTSAALFNLGLRGGEGAGSDPVVWACALWVFAVVGWAMAVWLTGRGPRV